MPGKVNPVIPEMVNQVCFDIIGGDVTVTMAAEAGASPPTASGLSR
jgi:aspartate ammonia-lyase